MEYDILDLNKVKELMDSDLTAWKISKDTGLSRDMVTGYKNGKDLTKMKVENGLKFQSYWAGIKKERLKMKFEDLQAVYYDGGSGTYDLQFMVDGNEKYIQVKAEDHPEAATNEDYFDDKAVVDEIIAED